MNKFSHKIHQQFISGRINSAVFNYMAKVASFIDNGQDFSLFDEHLRNLADLHIESAADCEKYFSICTNLYKHANELIKSAYSSEQLLKYAYSNKDRYDLTKNYNYSIIVLDFIKYSHPNNAGIESSMSVDLPFNLDKWVEVMRFIYNTANTNNLSLDSVTKQVVSAWPENEKINFQRWMRYYQEGNYSKYNVKTAQFFPYKQDTTKTSDPKEVSNMFDTSAFPTPDPHVAKKQKLDEARAKLRSRLVSLEQLVEQYRDVLPQDISMLIRKDVFDLKERVYGLELKASVVDSLMRTSNQLNKRGFVEGAVELKKIAQEVAQGTLPELSEPMTPEPQNLNQGAPSGAEKTPDISEDVQQIKVPEVNIGEESIDMPDFNSATHRDALQKLEEINKVIAERNVVRALAAVDIILGQLGIASYFPQLSEAQSKMMDAFNYAGSRVAETIGQMRGGGRDKAIVAVEPEKDVVEISDQAEKPVGEVINEGPRAVPPIAPKV